MVNFVNRSRRPKGILYSRFQVVGLTISGLIGPLNEFPVGYWQNPRQSILVVPADDLIAETASLRRSWFPG